MFTVSSGLPKRLEIFQFCVLDPSYYLKQEVVRGLFLGKEILLPAGVNCEFVILNLGSLLLQLWI